MYGDQKLNAHLLLRYSMTKEFFERFSYFQYKGIELPLIMMRRFHSYIRPFVDQRMNHPLYVDEAKKRHKLKTMTDVQQKLMRAPTMHRNLARVPYRQTRLLPIRLLPLALKTFKNEHVILMVNTPKELRAIDLKRLPQHFKLFRAYRAYKRVALSHKTKKHLSALLQRLQAESSRHDIFGTHRFQRWFAKHVVRAIKQVHIYDQLIRKHPIGIMLGDNLLDSPGNVLALLAHKYRLPYVFVQNHMLSDASLFPARATHYCMWGHEYKKWLNEKGIPASLIHKVGFLPLENKMTKRQITFHQQREWQIPSKHTVLCFTTQSFPPKVNLQMIKWIRSAVKNKKMTVFIKKHPSDRTVYPKKLTNAHIKWIPSSYHLYQILPHIDALMTISSTTALEAARLGKALIILQPSIPYHFHKAYNSFHQHLKKSNAGPVIHNRVELDQLFQELDRNKQLLQKMRETSRVFYTHAIEPIAQPSFMVGKVVQHLLQEKIARPHSQVRSIPIFGGITR